MAGQLYLIGTPLGNLGDLSPRAVAILQHLDVLYCEDTRHTAKLLAHFSISTPLRSLHDDSPEGYWQAAIQLAQSGKQIGYVSDAGMPGISDPGRKLLRLAWEAGLAPVVIPGPSAVTTLAAYCPFITGAFHFAGFVPRKASERAQFVQAISTAQEPLVFFESPRRVHEFLDELCMVLEPERELIIGRELTKLHEQVVLFTARDWPAWRATVPALGEFSLAVARAPEQPESLDVDAARQALGRLTAAGFSRRDALRALAAAWDTPLNRLKSLAYEPD